ncbi:MAG TPA: methyltransferase domain-containing protein [Povalibacter sp.]|nr:methyltransferase domain-containing protein [Povalibacter sp.]
MSANHPVNSDQAALWNGASGQAWVDLQSILDAVLAPFSPLLVEQAVHDQTRRVLDIGCGAGATTLAVAKQLKLQGTCIGADISAALVEVARRRASAEGLGNAAFIEADAQTHAFEPNSFDAAISRFGVMFFDDPVSAFANIRRAMRSEGTLAFVAWRSPAENPFMTTAMRAAAPFLPALPTPDPNGPGQFGFADPERVRGILHASGWRSIDIRPIDIPAAVSQQDLLTYVTRLGPVGAALREADEKTRAQVTDALRTAFASFVQDRAARFNMACWLVMARS